MECLYCGTKVHLQQKRYKREHTDDKDVYYAECETQGCFQAKLKAIKTVVPKEKILCEN